LQLDDLLNKDNADHDIIVFSTQEADSQRATYSSSKGKHTKAIKEYFGISGSSIYDELNAKYKRDNKSCSGCVKNKVSV
jgi:hypothetical protein